MRLRIPPAAVTFGVCDLAVPLMLRGQSLRQLKGTATAIRVLPHPPGAIVISSLHDQQTLCAVVHDVDFGALPALLSYLGGPATPVTMYEWSAPTPSHRTPIRSLRDHPVFPLTAQDLTAAYDRACVHDGYGRLSREAPLVASGAQAGAGWLHTLATPDAVISLYTEGVGSPVVQGFSTAVRQVLDERLELLPRPLRPPGR